VIDWSHGKGGASHSLLRQVSLEASEMAERCNQLPEFQARPDSSETGSRCQGAQRCQVLGIAPLENSHAGFLFCCPSSPHVLEGGMEMQSPAAVQMHQLRCVLSGILVSGLEHKGTKTQLLNLLC